MNSQLPSIYSFNEVSEVGLNDKNNSVIFVGGCNFHCEYCMNADLVGKSIKDHKEIPIEEIREKCNEYETECLVISGGEPLTLNNLDNLVDLIHSWDIMVGLCTNGYEPNKLLGIINFIDFVALDIKGNSPRVYHEITGKDGYDALRRIIRSLDVLRRQKSIDIDFEYEIRTTLYPPYIDIDSIDSIGKIFAVMNSEQWVLQPFRHTKHMLSDKAFNEKPYSDEYVKEMLECAKEYTPLVSIRYM